MKPVRPSIKPDRFARWKALAVKLGWGKRGGREKLMDAWMDHTDAYPDLFRKR